MFANGRVFTGDGRVIDPIAKTIVGRLQGFPSASSPIIAANSGQRILGVHGPLLFAADVATLRSLGSVHITGLGDGAAFMALWGTDGVAFQSNERIWFARTTF